MEKENTTARKTATFKEKSKEIRNKMAMTYANTYVKELDAGKVSEDPFIGLHGGCEAPMDICGEKCGWRQNCRLRIVRNIIHNALFTYGQAIESYYKNNNQ